MRAFDLGNTYKELVGVTSSLYDENLCVFGAIRLEKYSLVFRVFRQDKMLREQAVVPKSIKNLGFKWKAKRLNASICF